MPCPECGHRTPDGAKFCSECGCKLAAPAAPASPERAPRDYTPSHLADRILTSRAALEGERKQVTVLFADVRGSTELAERLDPEEWHRILDRFFQILTEGVHRFEGTVNQYTGDGIMALFGAPIAHEDHAQRACYAALWLRERLRDYTQELRRERSLDFATRMGLNSGEVVVGKIGDDLRMDYTAQGHAVNLAQRIEQLAEAGTAYLTQATADRVQGYFELDDQGLFNLKGSSEPVRVHALRGPGALRTRFDLSRARGLSRFVGRHAEMQRLDAALSAAEAGEGGTVALVADAGSGKSRLCWEFAERCRARGLRVHEAHCLPHGHSTPMAPVLELVRNVFGLEERDDPETMRRKIAGTLLLADPELASELPIVFEFLGVPDPSRTAPPLDPDARQRRLRAALGRLTAARSAQEPVVFLFEDLHWIDPASEEVLEQLAAQARKTRSLVLVNTRPEFRAAWLDEGRADVTRIGLSPLGPADLEELLFELLGRHESVQPLAPLLCERSGGNPFFLEELVQSLVESRALSGTHGAYTLAEPVERLDVPDSVHAVLAARIDRLAEGDKALLQTAAAIGRHFGEKLLARVAARDEADVHAALGRLESGEFVRATALYPEPAYDFRHALTLDVALASLLGDARRTIHRRVAEAMIEDAAERHDENAAEIARHLDEAGEAEAALPWYQRAAAWAGANYPSLTVEWWGRVREIATTLGRTELAGEAFQALLFDRARLGLSQEELAELMREAREAAEGNPRVLSMVLTGLQAPLFLQGRFLEVLELSEQALAAAETTGDPTLLLRTRSILGMQKGVVGRTRDALADLDALLVDTPGATPLLLQQPFVALANRGAFRASAGRLEEAARDLERAHTLTVEAGQPVFEALVESYRVIHAQLAGDAAGMRRHARRCADLESEVGSTAGTVMALQALAAAELENGNPSGASELGQRALDLLREANTYRFAESQLLSTLARAHAELGHGERAVALAREEVVLEASRGQELSEGPLTLARVLLQVNGAGSRDEVRAQLDQAREWIERHGQDGFLPELQRLEAELATLPPADR